MLIEEEQIRDVSSSARTNLKANERVAAPVEPLQGTQWDASFAVRFASGHAFEVEHVLVKNNATVTPRVRLWCFAWG